MKYVRTLLLNWWQSCELYATYPCTFAPSRENHVLMHDTSMDAVVATVMIS
jgi:hypothetical protein